MINNYLIKIKCFKTRRYISPMCIFIEILNKYNHLPVSVAAAIRHVRRQRKRTRANMSQNNANYNNIKLSFKVSGRLSVVIVYWYASARVLMSYKHIQETEYQPRFWWTVIGQWFQKEVSNTEVMSERANNFRMDFVVTDCWTSMRRRGSHFHLELTSNGRRISERTMC